MIKSDNFNISNRLENNNPKYMFYDDDTERENKAKLPHVLSLLPSDPLARNRRDKPARLALYSQMVAWCIPDLFPGPPGSPVDM